MSIAQAQFVRDHFTRQSDCLAQLTKMSLDFLRSSAMENTTVVYGILVLAGLLVCLRYIRKTASLGPGPGLPPGPAPLPVLGNIRDLPPKGSLEYQHWLRHKDLYGPVSSITTMGQTIVIIHDRHLAHEVLEKSSLKTSERPITEMSSKLRDLAAIIPNFAYNDVLRRCRKLIHQQMGTKKLVERFKGTQEIEVQKFLLRVLDRPEGLLDYVKIESSAIILRMTYGYSMKPDGTDPLVQLIELFLEQVISALTPGTWLVDIIPVLKYLPKGCPGTGFLKAIQRLVADFQKVENIPYEFVQEQMNNSAHRHSYVSRLIEESGGDVQGSNLSDIKSTAAAMYSAAVETTSSTLTIFLLAMLRFPEVQRKAQEEIDRVVGTDRLPGFEDQENLPYVKAAITEALRWFPALPMGFPHMAGQDIIAQDYLIPKGAIILPAVYWFTHDPEVYPRPDLYEPERFLKPRDEPDPRQVVFGYGRRICPGRYFADASIYLTIVQLLAAFNMSKAVDDRGVEIEPEFKLTPGVATHPEPFAIKITPRSAKHVELIRKMGQDLPWEEDDARHLDHYFQKGSGQKVSLSG